MSIVWPAGYCLDPGNMVAGQLAAQITLNRTQFAALFATMLANMAGGTLTAHLRAAAAVAATMDEYTVPAEAALNEYGELLAALWEPNAILASQAAGAAVAAAHALQRIVNTRIPAAVVQANAYTDAVGTEVRTYATELVGTESYYRIVGDIDTLASAEAYTDSVGTAVENYASELVAQEALQRIHGDEVTLATAREDIDAVAQYAATQIDAVVKLANADIATLSTDLQALEKYTASELQAGQVYTEQAVKAGETNVVDALAVETQTQLQPVWAGTATSMNQVTEQLKTAHPATTQGISAVDTDVPIDAALALAGVVSMLRTVAVATEECTLPYCTEKNRLGKAARTIAGLFSGGLMLAFLAAAITEPTATAEATIAPVEAVEDTVKGVIEALL